jgi:hypothetical protein
MIDGAPFGSSSYLTMLVLLLFARGADLFSTWVATPNLKLEGNPVAKKLGWKWGALFNLVICLVFATWQMPAIIIATAGFLVAGHNFQAAWLMRTLGETGYRDFFSESIGRRGLKLYMLCVCGETFLTALVGTGIVWYSPENTIPFAIGMGVLGYALIVFFYTSLGIWRMKRRMH